MPQPSRTGTHNTKSLTHPLPILLLPRFIQACHGYPVQEFTIQSPLPNLFQSSCCEGDTSMPWPSRTGTHNTKSFPTIFQDSFRRSDTIMAWPPRTGIHNTKSLPHPLPILLLPRFIQACHGHAMLEFTIQSPPSNLFQSSCCEGDTSMPWPSCTGTHNTKSLSHPLSILVSRR